MTEITDKLKYIYSYAQNREDLILGGFLNDISKGFYVDIGANHPTTDSVTKIYYDSGWNGINIEPIKSLFVTLQEARTRDINLNIAISNKNSTALFREYLDAAGLSTFSKELQSVYKKQNRALTEKYVEYDVKVQTLKEVFKANNVSVIHFMKIDVEGFENNVLQGNDWSIYRPWVLCIEANHSNSEWEKLLRGNEYTYVFDDGINKYYVSNEQVKRAEDFSYENTLLSKTVIQKNVKDLLDEERFLRKVSENTAKRRESENLYLKNELNRLHNVIAQSQGFKRSIKQLVRSLDSALKVYIENMNKPRIKHVEELVIRNKPQSAQKLLDQAREYDFNRLYSTRSNVRFSYIVVMKIYLTVTRVPLKILRKVRMIIRRELR